ncbi:uncharacterized protein BDV17DRAFT_295793 [Aspergillus undulatus]|uniref:uncharacterized protein n=1 Tax=Aspergillus undulatus TaxID=1810928 RepID=UPI003CCDD9A2
MAFRIGERSQHYLERFCSSAALPENHNGKAGDTHVNGDAAQVGGLNFNEYTQGGLGRVVGRIIGTGIFSTPSSITSSDGSVGAALLLWVLSLLLAGSGLAVWLELGCVIPRSGGEKVYLETAYTRPSLLIAGVFAV